MKCFSITFAPLEIARRAVSIPSMIAITSISDPTNCLGKLCIDRADKDMKKHKKDDEHY